GRSGAVIDLVADADLGGENGRGDIGTGAGGSVGGVIGCIGAADGDATDADGLIGADVVIGETGAGVSVAQAVARHPVVRKGDGGRRRAIIDFVGPGGTDRQGPRGDVG